MRGACKQRRKRYGSDDSRGRLAGKRLITERPAAVEMRRQLGHWEIDTVMGTGSKHCIVSLVERKAGLLLIGKLEDRTTASMNRRVIQIIKRHDGAFETITANDGTEFHHYSGIEARTQALFYFARPYHSWERGSNENVNGLIRQYLPKGTSMAGLSQPQCNAIARQLNQRPRKRLGFRTPLECYYESWSVLHFKLDVRLPSRFNLRQMACPTSPPKHEINQQRVSKCRQNSRRDNAGMAAYQRDDLIWRRLGEKRMHEKSTP